MPAKATIRNSYRWRLGIIALGLLGFAAWAFYDAYIAYPKYQEQYQAYEKVAAEYPTTYADEWKRVATERGWSTDRPKETSDSDILTQYLMMAGSLIVGLPFLYGFIRTYTRWVASDAQGLRASGGKVAPWPSITRLDSTRWKTKGIAYVHYENNGKDGRILLDDWKFEREPIVEIYGEVHEHLGLTDPEEEMTAGNAAVLDTEQDALDPTSPQSAHAAEIAPERG